VVGGLATNGCVDLTARDAADLGYETFVLEDGCVTFHG
jgi:nicotinamidase-related amidase